MKNKIRILSNFLILIAIIALSSCQQEAPKVLIIGIDGCRPDAMMVAQTPNMDALMWEGAYTMTAQTDPMTFSGPAWSAMLTGVFHEKHGVITNGYENPDTSNFPHFFRRYKEQFPEKKTYSLVNWGQIHKILQTGDADYAEEFPNDSIVTLAVVDKLLTEDPDVMFVQLDQVDGAGHRYDYVPESPNYLKAVEKADGQVGQMIQAVKDRSGYEKEDWLIIITTDHGGSDFGHGKDIPEHRNIFFILTGEKVQKGNIELNVNVVDVALTAMKHLGVKINPDWNLDGKAQ